MSVSTEFVLALNKFIFKLLTITTLKQALRQQIGRGKVDCKVISPSCLPAALLHSFKSGIGLKREF